MGWGEVSIAKAHYGGTRKIVEIVFLLTSIIFVRESKGTITPGTRQE
jgi:hypothetical protein